MVLLLSSTGCAGTSVTRERAEAPTVQPQTSERPTVQPSTPAPDGRTSPIEEPAPDVTVSPSPSPSHSHPPDGRPLAGRIIALDPGHNGANGRHPEQINRPVDAGGFQKPCNTTGTATASGFSEARFNWDVAVLVRERLEGLGATVLLTRDGNEGVGPCIDERGRFGAEVGADLLLSIHADGGPPEGRGFHVIRPDTVAGHTEDIVENSAALAQHVRRALVAAGLVPSTYRGEDGIDVRGDLGTLNQSDVPAVIVECGNMRHAGDADLLQSQAGQEQIAAALVAATAAYLAEPSRRVAR